MNVRKIAALAAIWQFSSWGGRIGLLVEDDVTQWDWIRIGTGLGIGVFLLAVAFWKNATTEFVQKVASSFLLLTIVIWGRSLLTVWSEANTLGFRMVHTVLALVTFLLGVALVRAAKEPSSS